MLLTKLATWAKILEMPSWDQLIDRMLNDVSYIHLLLFPVWFGVLFVRQGVYQGGIFRFCVHIPEAFPDGGCPVSL